MGMSVSTSAEIQYLSEVLGVQAIVCPESAEVFETKKIAHKKALVIASKDLNSHQNELLKKMLAAIQLHSFQLIKVSGADEISSLRDWALKANSLIVLNDETTNQFLKEIKSSALDLPQAHLFGFFEMADTSSQSQYISQLKKAAWAELQKLKSAMSTSKTK